MSKERFAQYIDKKAKAWWMALSDEQRFPFLQRWYDLDEDTLWNIYGLYLDHLLGIDYLSTMGELAK